MEETVMNKEITGSLLSHEMETKNTLMSDHKSLQEQVMDRSRKRQAEMTEDGNLLLSMVRPGRNLPPEKDIVQKVGIKRIKG